MLDKALGHDLSQYLGGRRLRDLFAMLAGTRNEIDRPIATYKYNLFKRMFYRRVCKSYFVFVSVS